LFRTSCSLENNAQKNKSDTIQTVEIILVKLALLVANYFSNSLIAENLIQNYNNFKDIKVFVSASVLLPHTEV